MGRTNEAAWADAKPEFQRALLGWYRANARSLPWRKEPSAYKTVVSEFMLQQTQVKTVLPYFARWLDAFPDFAALATADESRVLRLWEGLGYYSRARNLHRLARELQTRRVDVAGSGAASANADCNVIRYNRGDDLPRTATEWQQLPGVGPYTAAAIASIAFGAATACVDGNVVRILARLTANPTAFRDSATAAKALRPLADALLSTDAPGEHNQAMMELGATVCFRQKPACLTCPVRTFCAAARSGDPEAFPRLAARKIERHAVTRVWCERGGALLLHRASANARRFANLHELPRAEQAGLKPTAAARGRLLVRRRRAITRYQITESIHVVTAPRKLASAELVWVPLADLEHVTLSGPHRRWVREILATGAGS